MSGAAVGRRVAGALAVGVCALLAGAAGQAQASEFAGLDLARPLSPASALGSLSMGDYLHAVVRTDGTLASWYELPYALEAKPPAGTFTQVACGQSFCQGLRTNGTLAHWGATTVYLREQETSYFLFPWPGTFTHVAAGSHHGCGIRPDSTVACWGADVHNVLVAPGGPFLQVAAGLDFSCGIRPGGYTQCWGRGDYGQVSGGMGGGYTQITAGHFHACGLKIDGTVACWGFNDNGRASPPGGTFTQVEAGGYHTCGLRTNGTVACWGANTSGESTPPEGTFTRIAAGEARTCGLKTDGTLACWGSGWGERTPPSGSFSHPLAAAGADHTCQLGADGGLSCWGDNAYGQSAAPSGTFTEVAAGERHTCALRADGTLACWGDDSYGQSTAPADTFTQVTAGERHSCALRTDGSPVCWGDDSAGQSTPARPWFSEIVAGGYHTCGLSYNQQVSCWGDNSSGQSTPPLSTFLQLAAGGFHTCGIKTDGQVFCWGANSDGRCAPPVGTFTQVVAGNWHTCGLKTDGTLACWGDNTYGQSSPPDGEFIQIVAAGTHTCGLRASGMLVCWGGNSSGQAATVTFEEAASSGTEPTTPAPITVRLTAATTKTVTVRFASADGSAQASRDYTPVSGVLTFPPGETSKTIKVPILNNAFEEPDESFSVALSNPTYARLGKNTTHTYLIRDEDTSGEIRLSSPTYTVEEGGPAARVMVECIGGHSRPVSVNFSTEKGTAQAGSDYTPVSGTLTWVNGGKVTQSFTVPINDDMLDEKTESFTVRLSDPGGDALLGAQGSAVVKILDDDESPAARFEKASSSVVEAGSGASVPVTLSAPSGRPVSVRYRTEDRRATSGSDYLETAGTLVFPPGEIRGEIMVRPINDALREADETLGVILTDAKGGRVGEPAQHVLTIVDDDPLPRVQFSLASSTGAESTRSASIKVGLSAASGQNVSVHYATANGSARAGKDYTAVSGNLTFAPGETESVISVPILNDTLRESDEDFAVRLSKPVNATLGAPGAHTYTILDEDDSGAIRLSPSTQLVGEGGSRVMITAQRTGGHRGDVGVRFATADGTATAGADYGATAGELTWADGDAQDKTIVVLIGDDAVDEPNEWFTVTLSAPSGGVELARQQTATVGISDNDPAPTVRFEHPHSSCLESSGSAPLRVVLSGASASPVTAAYRTVDGTARGGNDYDRLAGLVEFPPGQTVQEVRVPLYNDSVSEADETLEVELSNPVGAVLGAPRRHEVTIEDNDAPPTVQFGLATSSGAESTGVARFGVSLSTASGREVAVHYATTEGSATEGGDYTTTLGTLLFAPGETSATIAVPVSNDAAQEGDETFAVNLSSPENAVLGGRSQHLYTIRNDDWTQGHAYEVVIDEGSSWTQAKAAAAAAEYSGMAGHLATVGTADEDSFLSGLIITEAIKVITHVVPPVVYLGGFQEPGSAEPGGGWRWVTGEPFGYTNWTTAEPNNWGGAESVLLTWLPEGSSGLQWNDGDASNPTSGYVIEYEPERPRYSGLEAPVTPPEARAEAPRIFGERVVWQDQRTGDGDIRLLDLATSLEQRVTFDAADQQAPAIDGGRIVWQDKRSGEWDIYLYRIDDREEICVTTGMGAAKAPAISGDRIVWQDYRSGDWDIYRFDLATMSETRITSGPSSQIQPAISGEKVVWLDTRNGGWDVYLYDLATLTETRITSSPAPRMAPAISGDKVVWQDGRNGGWDIYLYDLATLTETRISSGAGNEVAPAIAEDRIVWMDDRDGNWELYLLDLATWTESRVTSNPSTQGVPSVSGDRIVWMDDRSGEWGLYLAEPVH